MRSGFWFSIIVSIIFCASAVAAPPTYTISGIVATAEGVGVEGVDVVPDGGIAATITAADGSYSITVPKRWTGTVTVSKSGWLITPTSINYPPVDTDYTGQNYTAYQPKTSGVVTKSDGTPLVGATVTGDNGGGSDTTDASGYYEFHVPYNWSGTVSAILAGYYFTDKNYTNVIADHTNQNFSGYQPIIAGYVRKADGTVLEGASVTADNGGGSTSTDATGFYEIIVPYDWSGTVLPNLLAYDFTPKEYINIVAGQAGQDFIGTYVGIQVNWDGSGDFTTIQAAIDAATHGDIIHVVDGVYAGEGNRDIDFSGKAITVSGNVNAPTQVVIECDASTSDRHRGFNFISGEDPNSILEGFTVRNGVGPREDVYFDLHYRSVGGAIYCYYSSPTIRNCIFNNNKAIGSRIIGLTVYFGGGAIYNREGNPTIKECIFELNATENYGGAICSAYSSSAIVIDCTLTANSAQEYGGGIANCSGMSSIIKGCTIMDNIVYDGQGGGIYDVGTRLSIEDCTIIYNTAYYGGGGIYQFSGGNIDYMLIKNCDIIGNSASFGGGFCYVQGEGATIENCDFLNNSASGFGGGLFLDARVNMRNCLISANSSESGGGIYESAYRSTFQNCEVNNNTALVNGGGIYIHRSTSTFQNCTIQNNNTNNGGGIYIYDPYEEELLNCTITGNLAFNSGGGLYLNEGYANVFSNCIIWSNTESSPGFNYVGSGFNYNCIEGLGELVIDLGVGNIEENPLFTDASVGDYHLQPGSPCIDTADNTTVTNPNDLDGLPRIVDGDCDGTPTVDMGAYEFNPLYIGDFEGNDCDVDLGDFAVMAQSWLQDNPAIDIAPYLAPDGVIDLGELLVIVENWMLGTE